MKKIAIALLMIALLAVPVFASAEPSAEPAAADIYVSVEVTRAATATENGLLTYTMDDGTVIQIETPATGVAEAAPAEEPVAAEAPAASAEPAEETTAAASGEPAAAEAAASDEASEEASAETAVADPMNSKWAGIELVVVLVLIVELAIIMASFKKKSAK